MIGALAELGDSVLCQNAGELNGKAQRHRVGKKTGKLGHAVGVVSARPVLWLDAPYLRLPLILTRFYDSKCGRAPPLPG